MEWESVVKGGHSVMSNSEAEKHKRARERERERERGRKRRDRDEVHRSEEQRAPVPGSYELPNCFVIVRPSPQARVVHCTLCSVLGEPWYWTAFLRPGRNLPLRSVVVLVFIVKRCDRVGEDRSG